MHDSENKVQWFDGKAKRDFIEQQEKPGMLSWQGPNYNNSQPKPNSIMMSGPGKNHSKFNILDHPYNKDFETSPN